MEKLLLKEYNAFEYEEETLKESLSRNDGRFIVKGILQRAETLNQNGRVYPRHILAREIENYQKLIRENRALGECDHADTPVIELKHVSHVIREARMEGNIVYGTVEVLDTPSGEIVKKLLKAGVKIGISSRALGSVKKVGDHYVVQDDLQLICWDFVSDPSTPGAFMTPITENKKYDLNKFYTKSDLIYRSANNLIYVANSLKQKV